MSRIPKKLRERIFEAAHFTCEYCRSPQIYLWADLEIDHIKPKTKGGRTVYENLCSVCRKCNELKWIKTEVIALQLNRQRAVLLRRMWIKAGWRPPKD